eukprot:m51a1_g10437 hypothetical protein (1556) ;mRNA; r:57452-64652
MASGTPGPNLPAWEVPCGTADVYVGAQSPRVLALNPRALPLVANVSDEVTDALLWRAGQPFPADDPYIETIVDGIAVAERIWRNFSGRDAYDNKGGEVMITVHAPVTNAMWAVIRGTGAIVFGNDLISHSVMWHEYGHGITAFLDGLWYEAESGALNEAWSDIFSGAIDVLINNPAVRDEDVCPPYGTSHRWVIGWDCRHSICNVSGSDGRSFVGLRDMWQPTCVEFTPGMAYPNSVGDMFCLAVDNAGVHFNSLIPARTFTMLVDGSRKHNVSRVGLYPALKIFTRAKLLSTPMTTFSQFASSLRMSCDQLVGHDASISSQTCKSLDGAISATRLDSPVPCFKYTPSFYQDPNFPFTPAVFVSGAAGSAINVFVGGNITGGVSMRLSNGWTGTCDMSGAKVLHVDLAANSSNPTWLYRVQCPMPALEQTSQTLTLAFANTLAAPLEVTVHWASAPVLDNASYVPDVGIDIHSKNLLPAAAGQLCLLDVETGRKQPCINALLCTAETADPLASDTCTQVPAVGFRSDAAGVLRAQTGALPRGKYWVHVSQHGAAPMSKAAAVAARNAAASLQVCFDIEDVRVVVSEAVFGSVVADTNSDGCAQFGLEQGVSYNITATRDDYVVSQWTHTVSNNTDVVRFKMAGLETVVVVYKGRSVPCEVERGRMAGFLVQKAAETLWSVVGRPRGDFWLVLPSELADVEARLRKAYSTRQAVAGRGEALVVDDEAVLDSDFFAALAALRAAGRHRLEVVDRPQPALVAPESVDLAVEQVSGALGRDGALDAMLGMGDGREEMRQRLGPFALPALGRDGALDAMLGMGDGREEMRQRLGPFALPADQTPAFVCLRGRVRLPLLGRVARAPEPRTTGFESGGLTLAEVVRADVQAAAPTGTGEGTHTVAIVDKSGAGKTASVVAVAQRHYVVYMLARACASEVSQTADFVDRSFGAMVTRCQKRLRFLGGAPVMSHELRAVEEGNRQTVESLVYVELCVRLCALLALLRRGRLHGKMLEPARWIALQALGDIEAAVDTVAEQWSDTPYGNAKGLCHALLRAVAECARQADPQVGIVVAIDEAQKIVQVNSSGYFVRSSVQSRADGLAVTDADYRSILSPVCGALSRLSATVVVLGTALSLEDANVVESVVGKYKVFRVIKALPPCESVADALGSVIDLSGCTVSDEYERLLRGRMRSSFVVLDKLVQVLSHRSPTDTKQQLLDKALEMAVGCVDAALTAQATHFLESRPELHDSLSAALDQWLWRPAEGKTVILSAKTADLVGSALFDEPLAFRALDKALPPYHRLKRHIGMMHTLATEMSLSLNGTGIIGEAVQSIIYETLRGWNGIHVDRLPFVACIDGLPPWTATTRLDISSVGSAKAIRLRSGFRVDMPQAEMDFEFLARREVGTLLIPDQGTRPDGVLFMPGNHALLISIATRLAKRGREEALDAAKAVSDVRSTDLALCFRQEGRKMHWADEMARKSKKPRRKRYMQEYSKNPASGCLRLHFAFASKARAEQESHVSGQDVLVFINRDNLALFFDDRNEAGPDIMQSIIRTVKHTFTSVK